MHVLHSRKRTRGCLKTLRFFACGRSLPRAEDGASAIEFALLAPVLIIGLLGTVDVGRALSEQMAISSVLRAGAQAAVAENDIVAVERVLQTAAEKNFVLAPSGSSGDDALLALQVSRTCACAGNADAPVNCSTTCADSAPTSIYYNLAGEKKFLGFLLPRFDLRRSLQVQVR